MKLLKKELNLNSNWQLPKYYSTEASYLLFEKDIDLMFYNNQTTFP
ncbi:MAG: hypothetical protein IJH63_11350 [Methanobrevibacter sp.]|nr:hypothetical protein [Methanobrevibacter sp.]